MKMTIKHYILLLPLFFSCSSFLDKNPENKVAIDVLFSDMAGAKAALTGVYINMFSTSYYNGGRMVYPDLVAGNLINKNERLQTFMDLYYFSTDAEASGMNAVYSTMYQLLNNVNNIIKRAPDVTDGSEAEHNELLAQAYGLRALIHLDLVQLFAQDYAYTADASHLGVVIANEPILVGESQRERSSVAVVYDQIEADLAMSQDFFSKSKAVFTGSSVWYMNSRAVTALQARVCLNKGDWTAAYQFSEEVIATNFSLYSQAEYIASWSLSAAKETIFELAVPSSFAGNSLGSYYNEDVSNSYYQFAASADLSSLFEEGDIRSTSQNFKYASDGTEATTVKLIRLSEMYLIRAEAAAALGNQEQALADLNRIRLRAKPSASPAVFKDDTTLIAEILLERRRELYFEGFLFFDLKRRGLSVERSDCEGLHCNVSYPSDMFALPIPQQSVNANANMIQNPGY